jgi:predicted RNA-binding Zn-ribbon protein involved in translation (DUF1610 family)
MGLTVELECTQCGAPMDLDESDRLLACPFCGVRSYLFAQDHFRFILPHKTQDKEIIYAPYLRFKGNVFHCTDRTIGHRVVDITHLGVQIQGLPGSLGLRPQAMKMKFATQDAESTFLTPSVKLAELLDMAARHTSASASVEILHRVYIGEALSIIYLPLYIQEDTLFDAVLGRPLAKILEQHVDLRQGPNSGLKWNLTIMSTLCPRCGWNLEGESDSVVLTCGNCQTAWEASDGKFGQVNVLVVPGTGNTRYLPFWMISAETIGIEMNSFADFIRATNQPRAVQEGWEEQKVGFWIPAFKIRPKIFLLLSKQLTISQDRLQTEEGFPGKDLYPVTLKPSEAEQAIHLTIASSALNRKKILSILSDVRLNIRSSILVYLPFTDRGHEMVQQQVGMSINKRTLEFGKTL